LNEIDKRLEVCHGGTTPRTAGESGHAKSALPTDEAAVAERITDAAANLIIPNSAPSIGKTTSSSGARLGSSQLSHQCVVLTGHGLSQHSRRAKLARFDMRRHSTRDIVWFRSRQGGVPDGARTDEGES
jgi:hypothetical protein